VPSPTQSDRYSRQARFSGIGAAGQERLRAGRVLVVGCGALGTVAVDLLARAGVGHVTVVDRDVVERSNLQRQLLFDEADAAAGTPKAVAAAEAVARINSEVEVRPIVADVTPDNVERIVGEAQVVIDGTDNFETRYLINDAAVKLGKPWIYGGCIGSQGMMLPILPGDTPCLRCVVEDSPPPGTSPTCETAGILGSTVNIVASFQATEAFKILCGRTNVLRRAMLVLDIWENDQHDLKVSRLKDCPTCVGRRFDWLDGTLGSHTTTLCGRNAVQVAQRSKERLSFETLAQKLSPLGAVTHNRFMLKFQVDEFEFTVFPDGRAIIKGTSDIARAKSLYAQYVGI
jgi:adenylyltransferase/sulfurtransferase